MKILYITTIGSTMNFFKSLIAELINQGHTVDIACNDSITPVPEFYSQLGCKQYHIDCNRSPFSVGNIKCIKQIKEIVKKNEYDIVHCHTPIAAACSRLACKDIRKVRAKTKNRLRVFYTAHGFHFYSGSPKKNWIIYYPVEKMCARWTDVLITINKEDYALAKEKFEGLGRSKICNGCRVKYIPGVGIDVAKFANTIVDRKVKRAELGIPENAFLMLSIGELNKNKNHQIVIRALFDLLNEDYEKYKDYYYVIAGQGPLKQSLQNLIEELGLKNRALLLGYRNDCSELYKVSDLFVHPSYREGLPVSVLEALASGLPVIGSRIRGNNDLVCSNMLFDCTSTNELKRILRQSKINTSSLLEQYSLTSVNNANMRVYSEDSTYTKY